MTRGTRCAGCGATIDENVGPSEGRRSCPKCGSMNRLTALTLQVAVATAIAEIERRMTREGSGRHRHKYEYEDRERATLFGGATPARRRNVIDRAGNDYHEVIRDSTTGEILYELREPLDRHRGHGTAKGRDRG